MIGSTMIELSREENMIYFEVEAHYDEYNEDFIFEVEVNEKNDIIAVSYEGRDLDEAQYEDAEFSRAYNLVLGWMDSIQEFAKSGELDFDLSGE